MLASGPADSCTHPPLYSAGRCYQLRSLQLGPAKAPGERKLARCEAERVLASMMRDGAACSALRRLYGQLTYAASLMHLSNEAVLRGLTTRLDDGLGVGTLTLIEVDSFAPPLSKPAAQDESKEAQHIDSLLDELGPGDLHHAGNLYRLVRAPNNASISDRQRYEALHVREARRVMHAMASEATRPVRHQQVLAQLAKQLDNPKVEPDAELLVLQRIRTYVRPPDEAGQALTPSQLRRAQSHWIEVEAVDKDKLPVAGLTLELVLASGGTTIIQTDKSGLARVDSLQPGTIQIRVLDLDGSSWRPRGGAPASASSRQLGVRTHVVRKGECLSKVAHRYGVKDWRTLWDDPKNAALKKRRKNPHVLLPGDKIAVAPRVFEIARATNARHTIEVASAEKRVRVHLRALGGKPLQGLEYDYSYAVGDVLIEKPGSAPSDANGRIEEVVPITVRTIEIALRQSKLRLAFELSSLDPLLDQDTQQPVPSGTNQRLHALGYVASGQTGDGDEALALFQRMVLDREAPDGRPDTETLNALERAYTA